MPVPAVFSADIETDAAGPRDDLPRSHRAHPGRKSRWYCNPSPASRGSWKSAARSLWNLLVQPFLFHLESWGRAFVQASIVQSWRATFPAEKVEVYMVFLR